MKEGKIETYDNTIDNGWEFYLKFDDKQRKTPYYFWCICFVVILLVQNCKYNHPAMNYC